MTTSPPDEALHFRGKTLTPESPRPLHISEPSNIPVLENQMDPVFNDTSTYTKSDYTHYNNVRDGWSRTEGEEQGLYRDSGSLHGAKVPMNDMAALTPGFHPNPSGPYYPANVNTKATFQDPSPTHTAPAVPFTQGCGAMNEIDNAGSSAHLDVKENLRPSATGATLQALLDNFSQSSSAAPNGAAPHIEDSSIPQAPTGESQSQTLPARPPLHDPALQPTYPSQNDVSYHQYPSAPSTASSAYEIHSSNPALQPYQPFTPTAGAPGTSPAAPPAASSNQPQSSGGDSQMPQEAPTQAKKGRAEAILGRSTKLSDDDAPWGPEVQKKYDEFLHDERVYVTEGLWDRFPNGSRLFVVTKRDMFHRFHRFGKLAQISIKQAYGFIQFLEAGSCHAALQAEQGALVRGRKVHLEISKPQRSTKPGPTETARAPPSRRSRSPEFSRSSGPSRAPARTSGDRFDRSYEPSRLPFSDYRDEPSHRRRDDYRPPRSPRSPSPRPFRGRDGYRSRDRTPDRFERRERRRSRSRSRSRSPYSRDRRYRSHSPRPRGIYEGEADLPVPRRSPRDVPEVQVLVLEEIDRNFILHVENAFRNRGLRVDVLVLGPRIPLGAAVHRQFVEGVLAVVRLSRSNQFSRKIPLQIFDRSAGSGNIHFSGTLPSLFNGLPLLISVLDYPEVDANIAAEVMFHQAQSMIQRSAPASYVPNPAFPVPIPVVHPTLATLTQPPNMANLISSLDGPGLQSLLSALQRQAPLSQPVSAVQSPFASPNPPPPANLASLLTNATRPPHLPMAHTQHLPPPPPPPPFNLQPSGPPVINDPHLLSLLAKGMASQQPQSQAPIGTNVQNLMSQLSKWKQ
ncbi:hypothetical protein N7495_008559 [Penicillium taxi]|uniref:uncharacterized protein n=1 Tax=Penicillium taxi TaxID=168475 RepID=UPI002545293C|nr:uncharacterized protein N7495_008559 [Penicillium taxi]KAJ5888518.1 hypothetical protein N7495_008559 [Penicillium taxi]